MNGGKIFRLSYFREHTPEINSQLRNFLKDQLPQLLKVGYTFDSGTINIFESTSPGLSDVVFESYRIDEPYTPRIVLDFSCSKRYQALKQKRYLSGLMNCMCVKCFKFYIVDNKVNKKC